MGYGAAPGKLINDSRKLIINQRRSEKGCLLIYSNRIPSLWRQKVIKANARQIGVFCAVSRPWKTIQFGMVIEREGKIPQNQNKGMSLGRGAEVRPERPLDRV